MLLSVLQHLNLNLKTCAGSLYLRHTTQRSHPSREIRSTATYNHRNRARGWVGSKPIPSSRFQK